MTHSGRGRQVSFTAPKGKGKTQEVKKNLCLWLQSKSHLHINHMQGIT